MELVYLFQESAGVRIPFFDYDSNLFYLLVSHGGIWNRGRWEFIFLQGVNQQMNCAMNIEQFLKDLQFFNKLKNTPCVFVDKNASVPVRLFGFWERSWDWDYDDSMFPAQTSTVVAHNVQAYNAKPHNVGQNFPHQVRPALPAKVSPARTPPTEMLPARTPPTRTPPARTPPTGMLPARTPPTEMSLARTPPSPNADLSVFGARPLPEKFSEHWLTKLEAELRARKYSLRTIKIYIYFNRLICRILQKTPAEIQSEDITQFLADMEKNREYSASSLNLAISAFKFFYREVLKSDRIQEKHRPRNGGRLPMILSKEEVAKIIAMEKNPKHRLLLMLVYSSGLRVSEVVALKKEHIDLSRKLIFIKCGKGRKDRFTLLSERVAQFIIEYFNFFDIY